MDYYFIRSRRGKRFIHLDQSALTVFFVAHSMMEAANPTLHRTEVNLMDGDALDFLELEMANDAVVQRAEETVATASERLGLLVADAFHQGKDLRIPWEEEELVEATLQWANRLYTYLRQADTENFIIGMPQGEEDSLTLGFPESPQDFLIMYASSLANEVATALWED